MFYDDGTMIKTQKSLLMNYILNLAPHAVEQQYDIEGIVVDRGALLYHLPWPKVGTMEVVLAMYSEYVKSYHPRNVTKVVYLTGIKHLQPRLLSRNTVVCIHIIQQMSLYPLISRFQVTKVRSCK